MSTLMEKDVLIEMVAHAQATISLRVPLGTKKNEDQIYLTELRNYLYDTDHHSLNYEKLSDEIININNKYKTLPVNELYS